MRSLAFSCAICLRTKCSNYNAVWLHCSHCNKPCSLVLLLVFTCSFAIVSLHSISTLNTFFSAGLFLSWSTSLFLYFGIALVRWFYLHEVSNLFHRIQITLFDCNSCNVHLAQFPNRQSAHISELFLSPQFHSFNSFVEQTSECFCFLRQPNAGPMIERSLIYKVWTTWTFLFYSNASRFALIQSPMAGWASECNHPVYLVRLWFHRRKNIETKKVHLLLLSLIRQSFLSLLLLSYFSVGLKSRLFG